MTNRTRRLFSAEFKLEAAQLVIDQNYSVAEAAQAMNVGKSFVSLNKNDKAKRQKLRL